MVRGVFEGRQWREGERERRGDGGLEVLVRVVVDGWRLFSLGEFLAGLIHCFRRAGRQLCFNVCLFTDIGIERRVFKNNFSRLYPEKS